MKISIERQSGSISSGQLTDSFSLPTLSFLAAACLFNSAATAASDPAKPEARILETVVVTATREEALLSDTAASVGVITEADVKAIAPTHPEQLLNRIPGVNVVQIGSTGEGHMTAIRQPISTKPVYLFLENGVPVRSPAFFNHNGLYEVNVAGSQGVEVVKGPGSALYGSDAIGGVINVLSGQPGGDNKTTLGLEGGSNNWKRASIDGSSSVDGHDFSYNLNLSDNGGWRDHTESRKATFSGGWASDVSETLSQHTLLTVSRLDMSTGGSGLRYDDYKNDPEQAGNQIGFRDVSALRLSTQIDRTLDSGALSVTPFLRRNNLEYIATWTLRTSGPSPDAHINDSGHDSLGVLLKYRHDLDEDSLLISGMDIEYSRGYQKNTSIVRTEGETGPYWLSYNEAGLLYDYEVDFTSLSPYVHYERDLSDTVRLSAGLRFDSVQYDYDNRLSTDLTSTSHKRPEDQVVRHQHTSPKLGLTWQVTPTLNAFASWRHAFRIPSAGQLFRAGKNVDSTSLKPVRADNYEIGLRGALSGIRFETTLYYLQKNDDILTVTEDDGRRSENAGETRHYGAELGAGFDLAETLALDLTYTRSVNKYHDWVDRQGDFSGNHMPNAPEWTAGAILNWKPAFLDGGRMEWELVSRGSHWIDEKNADDGNASDRDEYEGHTLLNWRTSFQLDKDIQLYLNVLNLTNTHYAETTGVYGPTYTPGRPRTVIAGVKYTL